MRERRARDACAACQHGVCACFCAFCILRTLNIVSVPFFCVLPAFHISCAGVCRRNQVKILKTREITRPSDSVQNLGSSRVSVQNPSERQKGRIQNSESESWDSEAQRVARIQNSEFGGKCCNSRALRQNPESRIRIDGLLLTKREENPESRIRKRPLGFLREEERRIQNPEFKVREHDRQKNNGGRIQNPES